MASIMSLTSFDGSKKIKNKNKNKKQAKKKNTL